MDGARQTEKVNIMCIYWVGEFRGRDFTTMDVARLFETVYKHCDRPFDFYVLTNDLSCDVPGRKLPLLHPDDWPGWWAKMELHRGDLPSGRTLYMDLDSHAIRSLGPILDTPGDLVMFRTQASERQQRRTTERGWVFRYQAATMLFTPGKFVWLYEDFKKRSGILMHRYRSDQDIMGKFIPKQPVFPDKWLMKLGLLEKNKQFHKTPPKDVIIVTGQTKGGLFRKLDTIPWFESMARGDG